MALGTSNYSEMIKMTKMIDEVFAKRIEVAKDLFVNEGKLMLQEFRERQNSARHIPYVKGSKAAKKTVKNKEEKEADKSEAIAYAKAHSNDPPMLNKGLTWINRTARTVRGVHCYVDKSATEIAVGLYHMMPQGVYLEYAHNRKYAVIEPIVRQHAEPLTRKLNLMFIGK